MSEKPILFNTDMVQAILEDRKTVTRRLPSKVIENKWYEYDEYVSAVMPNDIGCVRLYEKEFYEQYPPYQVGDILYVRETWKVKSAWSGSYGGCEIEYKAGGSKTFDSVIKLPDKKWHPSIHMPKEAARIWLKVINVRVERLQDITVDGCKAEGIYDDYKTLSPEYHDMLMEKAYPDTFKKLWNSTIKKQELDSYGWDSNPWVWVIEFERIEREVQSGSCE